LANAACMEAMRWFGGRPSAGCHLAATLVCQMSCGGWCVAGKELACADELHDSSLA